MYIVAPSIEGDQVVSLTCTRLQLSQSCVYKRPSLRTLAVVAPSIEGDQVASLPCTRLLLSQS